ncbi:MAG TPA: NAD(P)/FAD-dependent oxidoreductase [Chitinophagales bacterium]|nr:NAD(P)/FAD-dependent oxidoreductase [Chitinophagales bacterium]
MNNSQSSHLADKPRLIIVGGGFAGLNLARRLKDTAFEILLIDKVNHHQFQPLFYQVAAAELEPSNISFPLRGIFHGSKNVRIRLGEVQKIFPSPIREDSFGKESIRTENKITTTAGEYHYDFLVIATGATTNFFGNKNLEQFTLPMKSTSEAIAIRQYILQNFEAALTAPVGEQEGLMNFVIAGGGPTGVELAGALAEMKTNSLQRDYPEIDFSHMRIMLVEGSPKTLGTMSEAASAKSKEYLEKMGVTVWTNTTVKDYDGKNVILSNEKTIRSDTVIWAAGVRGNMIEGLNPELIMRGNRMKVDRFNRVEGYENIFAIGDIAYMTTEKYPNAHPQVANVAVSQAKVLAKNLKNILHNKSLIQYEYKDKGSLATVGKHKAVVDLPYIKFQGFFAWFVWMGLHLVLLMGMKNRLFVFIDWVISYFSNNSTLRLIFRPFNRRN